MDTLLELCDVIAWLHPPDQPRQPAHVEMIDPASFADRVARARRLA
jgi:hypothetical protein